MILDEIGRGTATFDGLSIAWAVGRASARGERLPRAVRHALSRTHIAGLETAGTRLPLHARQGWQGEVIFLHEVGPGTADRSYGIHVARLAGLPAAAVERAEEVLHTCGER